VSFLGTIISKNKVENFFATISAVITPPLGIPKTTAVFCSSTFLTLSFRDSPKTSAAATLSLNLN
jgi:hypothetical protein